MFGDDVPVLQYRQKVHVLLQFYRHLGGEGKEEGENLIQKVICGWIYVNVEGCVKYLISDIAGDQTNTLV